MQIKVDAEKVKHWREERCWTQEHLAGTAGISLRTVQRIENGEPASRETILALAAAFDVDVSIMALDVHGEIERAKLTEAVKKNAEFRLSFWIHLTTYIFVIALLFALNYTKTPEKIWVLWPAIGWGIGVLAHGATAFIVSTTEKTKSKIEALD